MNFIASDSFQLIDYSGNLEATVKEGSHGAFWGSVWAIVFGVSGAVAGLTLAAFGDYKWALITGVGIRVAAVAGTALLVLMFTVVLPPENNVFMDDHLIYAMVLVALAALGVGATLGLGRRWEQLSIVQKHHWLQ